MIVIRLRNSEAGNAQVELWDSETAQRLDVRPLILPLEKLVQAQVQFPDWAPVRRVIENTPNEDQPRTL